MTPPLLWAAVSSQPLYRGVTGSSLGVARPSLWPGLGSACAVEARRAVEASSEAAAQWPVSVPGGQSW